MLEPRSRRPKSNPTRITEKFKQQALDVRAALEASGLDYGPISVFEKMRTMGLEPPSEASLARIFRQKGVARLEPKKRPRAAWRRFVYPAPNACWQLDATEYVLTGGRKCVIFQLEDDHSRVAVASHVASGETSQAALAVVKKGIAAYGVPQRLLSDNGNALNPSRRGWQGQLVAYVTSLGVEAITGKPGRPTTQGKNERFHQTLFRWLDKQPLADSLEQLQAQVDKFDVIYNTERPHQGLPGRSTPARAWAATPVAEAPRPRPAPVEPIMSPADAETTPTAEEPTVVWAEHRTSDHGYRELPISRNGTVPLRGIKFLISRRMTGHTVRAVWDSTGVVFFDSNGEIIAEHDWPPQNIKYISNRFPPGRPSDQ